MVASREKKNAVSCCRYLLKKIIYVIIQCKRCICVIIIIEISYMQLHKKEIENDYYSSGQAEAGPIKR